MHFFICEMRKKLGRTEYIRVGIGLYMAALGSDQAATRDDQGRPGTTRLRPRQQQDTRAAAANTPTHQRTPTHTNAHQRSSRTAPPHTTAHQRTPPHTTTTTVKNQPTTVETHTNNAQTTQGQSQGITPNQWERLAQRKETT